MDSKHKHLDYLQAVIARLAHNSFLIKGWSLTLISALFAFSDKSKDHGYALITYLPVIVFWVLDACYLSQERQYRALYAEVAGKAPEDIDFSMNASGYNSDGCTFFDCFWRPTVVWFHGTLLAVTLLVMFILE